MFYTKKSVITPRLYFRRRNDQDILDENIFIHLSDIIIIDTIDWVSKQLKDI